MSRRRVVDLEASQVILLCPGCGASLAWVTRADVRPIVHGIMFRCRTGCHRRILEVRCRACLRIVLMHETSDGRLTAFPGDQRDLLRSLREQHREAVAEDTRWTR